MDFQEFREKYEHKNVEEYPNKVPASPIVSVCVQTYNQVDYIKKCLDGILMQQTNFPIEILLGEDGSNDGTREICIEYAEKHSDKIRLFLHHRENNIKIKGHPTGRFNFLYNLYSAKGKYIAICESDDYWTHPLKLQKQMDFLEENKDYSLCIHNAIRIDARNNTESLFNKKEMPTTIKTKDVILRPWFSPTASILFRNEKISFDSWNGISGDIMILFLASLQGNIYYFDEIMSVYNYSTPNSISANSSWLNLYEKKLNFLKNVDKHTNFKFFIYTCYKRVKIYLAILLKYFRHV